MKIVLRWAALVAAVGAALSAQATQLNIDFGQFGIPSAAYGAASGQAGVWNEIDTLGSSNLVDLAGNASGATLDLAAASISGVQWVGSSNAALLRQDNFYVSSGNLWSIAIAGLEDGFYDVYYYSPTHLSLITGPFSVNGTGVPSIKGDPSDSMIQGSDWDWVEGIPVTGGTLLLESTSNLDLRGLSGLQLVHSAVPEPASLAVIGVGLAALARRRNRR